MFANLVIPKPEKKEVKMVERNPVYGFNILSDGSLVKVHRQTIEITKDTSKKIININEIIFRAEIVELSSHYLALFCPGVATLPIININQQKIVASKEFDERISTLSALCDGSFLINSKLLCYLKNNEIISQNDNCFLQYHLNLPPTATEFFPNYSPYDTGSHFIPLADHSGFIHYRNNDQSTIRMINNELEPKEKMPHQLQLGPALKKASFLRGIFFGDVPTNISNIDYLVSSEEFFACVTRCEDKKRGADGISSHYLHVVSNDLKNSYWVCLENLIPKKLIIFNNQYIAVLGKNHSSSGKISLKIFDSHCRKIKKFNLIEACNVDFDYIAMSLEDQLITCNSMGITRIHSIFSTEKLKTESIILKNTTLPQDIIPLITEYAGFFKPDNRLKHFDYEDERSFFRYLFNKK